jgi:hypothetical protein
MPDEMIFPDMVSRVIKQNFLTRNRVISFSMSVFPVITALASEGEIFQRIGASFGARNNVLNRKRIR